MNIANKLKIFQIINLTQGLSALLLLALNHSDDSHAVIFFYSRNKFLLMLFIFVIILFMGYSFAKSFGAESQNRGESAIIYLLKKNTWIWILALLVIWEFFIVIQKYSPALLSIIWPIILWSGLFVIEIVTLKILVNGIPKSTNLSNNLSKKYEIIIGYAILVVGIVIGYLLRYYGGFVDEGDHIAGGWLISKNYIIYKDFFSHHPPFVYYWVGWMIDLVGNDIGTIRFSMVILQVLVIIFTMHITEYFIPLSLSTLIWIIISPYYYGNLILYQVFSGTFIVSSIAIFISMVTNRPTLKKLISLGLLAGLALSSDPQMVWPITFIYIGIFIILLLPSRTGTFANARIYFLVSMTPVIIIGILWITYFVLNDAINELIYDLITFNTDIYSKYSSANTFRLPEILQQASHFLYIFDPKWFNNINFSNYSLHINPDYDFFTGFFFRLSTICLVIYFLASKRILLGGILYLIICTLFTRSFGWFHNIPFVKTALFVLFIFLFMQKDDINRNHNDRNGQTNKYVSYIAPAIKVIFSILLITLVSKAVLGTINNSENLSQNIYYDETEKYIDLLSDYTCGETNWRYLNYPLNPIMYYVLEKEPASKYIFMTPWVAEIGQDEVIMSLAKKEKTVVYIWLDGEIWGYPVNDYLSNLITFLQNNYFEVATGYWVSPDIRQNCIDQNR